MCNRYVTPAEAEVERFWNVGRANPPRIWPAAVYPHALGPFVRQSGAGRELVLGPWGMIPPFAATRELRYQTNNARAETVAVKPVFRGAWRKGQRCIIPAASFDEPCWETGQNVWWRFRRADGAPWALAGLWDAWTDRATGEIVESYTMLTINAYQHPLMGRMHRPDPKRSPDQQDKRSVVAIELEDVEQWLTGTESDARTLLRLSPMSVFDARPVAA